MKRRWQTITESGERARRARLVYNYLLIAFASRRHRCRHRRHRRRRRRCGGGRRRRVCRTEKGPLTSCFPNHRTIHYYRL